MPLFAAIAVGLIVGAAIRFRDIPQTAVVAVYVGVLVSCAATDLATFRVLNVITYPAILFAFLVGAFMPGSDFVETIVGGALAGGLMLLALIVTRGAGDEDTDVNGNDRCLGDVAEADGGADDKTDGNGGEQRHSPGVLPN